MDGVVLVFTGNSRRGIFVKLGNELLVEIAWLSLGLVILGGRFYLVEVYLVGR